MNTMIPRAARDAYVCKSCLRALASRGAIVRSKDHSSKRREYATTSSTDTDIYDIVCVGGGPAGLSLLSALRASGATSRLKLALVEAQDLRPPSTWSLPTDKYSNRVSSLTSSSVEYLKKIGVWEHLDQSRIQHYEEMQVWDGVSGSRISFDWPPTASRKTEKDRTIAYMTENANLVSGLLRRTEDVGGIDVFDQVRLDSISQGEEAEGVKGWPILQLSSGQKLASRLLVGADGANSPVRKFAGIESRGWDYERHAVVATVELDGNGWGGEDFKIAYQRFLPSGPIALLPLPGRFSTLVWSTTPSHASYLKKLPLVQFSAIVNAGFRLSPTDVDYMHSSTCSDPADELQWRQKYTLYNPQMIPQRIVNVQEGSVASFPLKMRHADTYTSDRVALVGDAAHTIHPLAGQGLNQGQGDIQALVRTIEFAVEHGQDIGAQLTLEPYVSERYAANNTMLGVVDKLHKLYAYQSAPVVALRSWGLELVDSIGAVKGALMNRAAGN